MPPTTNAAASEGRPPAKREGDRDHGQRQQTKRAALLQPEDGVEHRSDRVDRERHDDG